jgi:prepilin-type processing-associated H-X9-DG protein
MDQFTQNPVSQTVSPRNSTLAVISFIMGLLCLTCILWPLLGLPAIICGIIALVKISGSNGSLKGKGYAITGIVIPAVMTVFVPILAMLAAIAFPAFSQAISSQQNLMCANNERQLVLALITYAEDSSGQLPAENWMDVIKEKGILKDETVFDCPGVMEQNAAYVLNQYIKNINEVKNPARTVLIFEAESDGDGLGKPEDMIFPHKQGESEACNVGFVDGHTELVTIENMGTLLWFPDQQ